MSRNDSPGYVSNKNPSLPPAVILSKMRPRSPAAGLIHAATVKPFAKEMSGGGCAAAPALPATSFQFRRRTVRVPTPRHLAISPSKPAAAAGIHAESQRMFAGRQFRMIALD